MEKLIEQSIWIQQSGLYEKDPQLSENGRQIVLHSVRMIAEEGLDGFTLKKLALQCGITEPTVYRYFSNKIGLCAYICSIHWTWRQWQLVIATNNLRSGKKKLNTIVDTLMEDVPDRLIMRGLKCTDLTTIVQREWARLLHPMHCTPATVQSYEELINRISQMVIEANPHYAHSKEFARMILELSFANYPASAESKKISVRHSAKFIKHLIEQL